MELFRSPPKFAPNLALEETSPDPPSKVEQDSESGLLLQYKHSALSLGYWEDLQLMGRHQRQQQQQTQKAKTQTTQTSKQASILSERTKGTHQTKQSNNQTRSRGKDDQSSAAEPAEQPPHGKKSVQRMILISRLEMFEEDSEEGCLFVGPWWPSFQPGAACSAVHIEPWLAKVETMLTSSLLRKILLRCFGSSLPRQGAEKPLHVIESHRVADAIISFQALKILERMLCLFQHQFAHAVDYSTIRHWLAVTAWSRTCHMCGRRGSRKPSSLVTHYALPSMKSILTA